MAVTKKQKFAFPKPDQLPELAEFRFHLRRFLSFSETAAESVGISVQQYQLLQVVGTVPEGSVCSVSYIADRMLLRHNSAVELVDRAERSGLVRRIADEADHRRSLVEATERGELLLISLAEAHLKEIEKNGPALVRSLQSIISARQALRRSETQ